MSQPIITTDISAIRPVFTEGTAENIKRYTQLKKMFATGKEYAVLAEPMLDGPNKITWHTEFEGTPAAFSKLTEEEQNAAKGRIKYQVNKLYKAVFKQLYHNSMSDVEEMFNILDSCIEIPDYDNIYRIQKPDGKCNYVLIKWGFNTDDFNAQNQLIKKLIPTKVDTVKIKVIKNSKPASNETVSVVYNKKTAQLTTDSKGYVFLEDIPLGDNFSAYSNEDKDTITEYLCDGSDEYHLLIGTKSCDMHFQITDAKGVPLADTEISFTYDGRTYFETTDSQGRIILRDIAEGTEVVVKQKNSKQTFFCDINEKEYIFLGTRPTAEIEVAVIDDKGDYIPGIDVTFSYNDKQMTVSTDRNGRVSIDNMPPDTEFKIESNSSQYQKAFASLISHEGLNMAEIKVRKISSFGCMTIKVVDEKGNPIVNTLIRCENDDTRAEFYTNDNGEIALDKVNYGSNVVCTQIIDGLGAHRHTFSFQQDVTDYVFKGGMILEKSVISDFEIQVTNKQKAKVPNLRVTIDDGHKVVTKITDSEGKIFIPGIKRGKYFITTEYKNKTTEIEYTCAKEKELLKIQVGRKDLDFLIWLIPSILLLGWLIVEYLVPKINEIMSEPLLVSDTTKTEVPAIDTTAAIIKEPEPEPVKGITLTITDEKTGKVIEGAKIHLEYGDDKTKLEGISDANGVFNFKDVPMDSTVQISATVEADNYPAYKTQFMFEENKTLAIPEKSLDINDIAVECGTEVKSEGYHSTIQTVRIDKTKGSVSIGYDMFEIPDELIIYNGKASEISDDKIIYRTKGFVKGPFKRASFNVDAPDNYITVRINGGDNNRTEWYFRVYCAKGKSSKSSKTKK
ncbi:MAG: carboxypeptidase regulatory-like domain-containing protein [Bacteroidales bacterium]|jgi:hypothetical protein|nr:carboxypeptidase regulatory-like domain-containing protein [Bacteroidales bacterium]